MCVTYQKTMTIIHLTSGIFQEEIDLSTTMLRFHLANFLMFFAWASGSLQKKFK